MANRRDVSKTAANTAVAVLGSVEQAASTVETLFSAGNNLAVAADNRSAIFAETSTEGAQLQRDRIVFERRKQRLELEQEIAEFEKSLKARKK